MIAAERQRQIDVERWTPEHDDEHDRGEMSGAAQAYAFAARCQVVAVANGEQPMTGEYLYARVPMGWPVAWDESWWKPSDDPVRNLVKAGALIAAEIDRLQRRD